MATAVAPKVWQQASMGEIEIELLRLCSYCDWTIHKNQSDYIPYHLGN